MTWLRHAILTISSTVGLVYLFLHIHKALIWFSRHDSDPPISSLDDAGGQVMPIACTALTSPNML